MAVSHRKAQQSRRFRPMRVPSSPTSQLRADVGQGEGDPLPAAEALARAGRHHPLRVVGERAIDRGLVEAVYGGKLVEIQSEGYLTPANGETVAYLVSAPAFAAICARAYAGDDTDTDTGTGTAAGANSPPDPAPVPASGGRLPDATPRRENRGRRRPSPTPLELSVVS
jgi:hypothetical protein